MLFFCFFVFLLAPPVYSSYVELKSKTNLTSRVTSNNIIPTQKMTKTSNRYKKKHSKSLCSQKMFLKIQLAGSVLPCLQIKSSLGSPSAQVFVIRELRTDHDEVNSPLIRKDN